MLLGGNESERSAVNALERFQEATEEKQGGAGRASAGTRLLLGAGMPSGADRFAHPSGAGTQRRRLSCREPRAHNSEQRRSSSGTCTPPSLSREEARLLRRTPQQYSLEQALGIQLETAGKRGGLSNSLR